MNFGGLLRKLFKCQLLNENVLFTHIICSKNIKSFETNKFKLILPRKKRVEQQKYYSFVSLTSYLEHDSGCRCVCFQCGHNNGMTQTGVDAVIYLLIALGAKMRQNAAYVLQKEAVTMPIRQTVGVASSSTY